jgi:hypothetical protein
MQAPVNLAFLTTKECMRVILSGYEHGLPRQRSVRSLLFSRVAIYGHLKNIQARLLTALTKKELS